MIFAAVTHRPIDISEALDMIDGAESHATRLQSLADALHAMGFRRVVASLRDASFTATMVVRAGESDVGASLDPLPGAVWRRRIFAIERFRVEDMYMLDGADPWVSREFFGADASAPSEDASAWLATDLIVGMLRGLEGEIVGVVKMMAPSDGRRPSSQRLREISWLLRHTSSRLSHDSLTALAQRRAGRLQRLQEAGAALARSLDEDEIVRELARQAIRATGADGAQLAVPDIDRDELRTTYRIVRGVEKPRAPRPLGDGVIAHVARTGRAFRAGDREADRAHRLREGTVALPSSLDIVDDIENVPSVLAVPLLAGIRLVGVLAVHAAQREVFSAEDEEVLATMASQAATAIANAKRYAESERERRQTEALSDVARAVGASLRQGEVLRLILRHTLALLNTRGACIALRSGDYMHIVAAAGEAEVLAGVHLPVATSLLGKAVTTGDFVISNEFDRDPNSSRSVKRLAPIERALIAPLVSANNTIGAIAIINRAAPYTDEDAKVLRRLSDQVSVAISNARLFGEVERATKEWKVAFDSAANGMVVLDDTGRVRRCNASAARLTRAQTIPALLGSNFAESLLSVGNVEAGIDTLIRQSREDGDAVRATLRDEDRGMLFDLTVAPHPDGGSVIIFDDVTEVHGLAERHKRVLEMASEAIIITGTNRRVVYANPAAHKLFLSADLTGKPTSELTPSDAIEQLHSAESAALAGTVQRYQLPVLRSDGKVRLVSISSSPLVELGQTTGTVACLRDVTDMRADALALARSESRYERLVESATDAIFTVDTNGCFTSANKSMEEASGYSREQLMGVSCLELVDERDRALAAETLEQVFKGERHKVQLRCIGIEKNIIVVSMLVAPIADQERIVGCLAVVRDVTEEEMEREAARQTEQLASMGRVLGGIANDLNNPLSSLLAVAELHADSLSADDSSRKALEQIRDEARRASRIVKHLLGVANGIATDRSTVKLNQLVRDTLDLHGHLLRERHVTVRLELSAEDPSVRGNTTQLQQVMVNLLKNAGEVFEDWSGERLVRLRTSVQGELATIVIEDSGPGISAVHLPRIFEPWYTTQTDDQKRGLGLAVTRAVLIEHGGDISCESVEGNGAVFTITMPLVMHAAPVRCETDAPSSASILLVEDESTLSSAIERYLMHHGMSVTVASNGDDALTAIGEQKFDVILLDLRMYGMQGDDVYRKIEAIDKDQASRVVFVTGDMHNESVLEFIASTSRPAIAKPFQLSELKARIKSVLKARSR